MRELAAMIQHELSDPRLHMVTVSHVTVTADLKYAKVFVTQLTSTDSGQDQDSAQCIAALTKAAGFLRRGIAKRIDIRTVPELRFYYDNTLDQGFKMDALIAKANTDLADN